MPIKRKPGESVESCMKRAMKENLKKYPYKQALAISLSQCGLSKKSKKTKDDWNFYFRIIYKEEIAKEKNEI